MIIDSTTTLLVMFCCLCVLLIALFLIFKDRLVEWDNSMRENLSKFMHNKKEVSNIGDFMPTVSYEVEEVAPNGLNVMRNHFVCSAPTFEQAFEGVFNLRQMSKGKLDVEPEAKPKNNFIGVR